MDADGLNDYLETDFESSFLENLENLQQNENDRESSRADSKRQRVENLENKRESSRTNSRRRVEIRKWKEEEITTILEHLKSFIQMNLEIEKPNVAKFYDNVVQELKLPKTSGNQLRCKMAHMKKLYNKAKQWQSQTGQGVDAGTVQGYINKICPNYDDLEEIFGSKVNINPPFTFDSGNSSSWNFEEIIESDCNESISESSSRQGNSAKEDEILEKFKLHLRTPTNLNRKKKVNSSECLAAIQQERIEALKNQTELGEKRFEKEMELKREMFEYQKQVDERKLKFEEDLELKKLELRLREIESNERIEKFKIECQYNYRQN